MIEIASPATPQLSSLCRWSFDCADGAWSMMLRQRRAYIHTVPQRGTVTATDAWIKKVSDTIEFRVGTASWTDPTLVNSELFYPHSARSAEERLRFYAEQFNTVEVNFDLLCLARRAQREVVGGANAHRVCLQYQTVRADDAASGRDLTASKAVA